MASLCSTVHLSSIKGTVSSISTVKRRDDVGAFVATLAHGCLLMRATSDGVVQPFHIGKNFFSDTLLTSSALCAQQPVGLLGDIRGNLFSLSLEQDAMANPATGLSAITPQGLSEFGGVRSLSMFAAQPLDVLCTYSSRAAIVDLRSNSLVHGFILPSFLTAVTAQPVSYNSSEFAVATKEGTVLFFDMRQNRNEPTMVVSCQDHLTSMASNMEDTIVLGAVSGRCYFMRSASSRVMEQAVAVTGSKRSAVLSLDASGKQVLVGTSDGKSALISPHALNESRMFPTISRGDPDFASHPAPHEPENGDAALHSTNRSNSGCAAVAISNSYLWITESANLLQKTYIEVRALCS